MRRLLPQSLAGQTVIVLLIGLTVSHVISMAIYTVDRADALTMSGGRQMAYRVATIARLLDKTPEEWRHRILQAANSLTMRVAAAPVSMLAKDQSHGVEDSLLRKHLASLIGTTDESRVLVQMIDAGDKPNIDVGKSFQPSGHTAHMFYGYVGGQLLRASVRLRDGTWLNFVATAPRGEPLWSTKAALPMLLMAVAFILFSLWLIRRVTWPLRVFAAASERLGKDVAAPPLVIDGPSELRQAAGAFNEMQQRLRRLIENRTHMLAAISHDLRTPITLLKLRAESVKDREERAKMQSTLDEMEAMVSSTLSFAREDAENEAPVRVDLAALVRSICDDMTDTGYRVELYDDGELIHQCRPGAIKRAISNLIENAIKYGGRARVELRGIDSFVEIIVEDDGPGIPKAELDKVFLPFYRVEHSRDRKTGGIGLGLSVAQSVVDKHGGEIGLTNREEGGLRVRVVLPA